MWLLESVLVVMVMKEDRRGEEKRTKQLRPDDWLLEAKVEASSSVTGSMQPRQLAAKSWSVCEETLRCVACAWRVRGHMSLRHNFDSTSNRVSRDRDNHSLRRLSCFTVDLCAFDSLRLKPNSLT